MPKPDNPIEHKFYTFETKSVDLDKSEFTGFSAAMGNEDLGKDIIEPGAFKKTISERVAAGKVKFLDTHNSMTTRNVWGTITDAKEVEVDGSGPDFPSHKLHTTFSVSEADADAQIALRKIKEGHLDQLSIGFKALKVEFEINEDSDFDDPRTAWIFGEGKRRIKEVQWWETSIVPFAMNPEATIVQNSLKSLTNFVQRVEQKGIQVEENHIKEVMLALSSLLQNDSDSKNTRDAVAKALDEVGEAVDSVCSLAGKRLDPVAELLEEFKSEQEDWEKTDFGIWVTEKAFPVEEEKECGCEDEDKIEDDSCNCNNEEKETEETEEEKENDVEENESEDDLALAVGMLSETISSLKEVLVGAEETDSPETEENTDADSPEEEKEEPHTEDDMEEAAKNTDTEDASHSEHFPDQDELRTQLQILELID